MFDIGWQELIVLGAVALVVFPPKEFPNLLKTIISITNKVRSTTQELQHNIHNFSKTHLEDITSETAKTRNLIHDSSHRIKKQIQNLEQRAKDAAKNPSPKTSPKVKISKVKTPKPKTTAPKTPKVKAATPKAVRPTRTSSSKSKSKSKPLSKPSPSAT